MHCWQLVSELVTNYKRLRGAASHLPHFASAGLAREVRQASHVFRNLNTMIQLKLNMLQMKFIIIWAANFMLKIKVIELKDL